MEISTDFWNKYVPRHKKNSMWKRDNKENQCGSKYLMMPVYVQISSGDWNID
jgi:hypothetical protein